jgi:hypothetical protein
VIVISHSELVHAVWKRMHITHSLSCSSCACNTLLLLPLLLLLLLPLQQFLCGQAAQRGRAQQRKEGLSQSYERSSTTFTLWQSGHGAARVYQSGRALAGA